MPEDHSAAVTDPVKWLGSRMDVQQQQQQQQAIRTEASTDPAEDSRQQKIAALIAQLVTTDTPLRRNARSQLAIFRQPAVTPMLAAVRETALAAERERSPTTENVAYNTRLGAMTALSRMLQPITLDQGQATQVAALIGAPDADTRIATADFLMNLENASTIQNVFDAMSALLDKHQGPQESGNLVKNSMGILGTWARVLREDIRAPDDTPIKEQARRELEKRKKKLEENPTGWDQSIGIAKDHLQRTSTQRAAR